MTDLEPKITLFHLTLNQNMRFSCEMSFQSLNNMGFNSLLSDNEVTEKKQKKSWGLKSWSGKTLIPRTHTHACMHTTLRKDAPNDT